MPAVVLRPQFLVRPRLVPRYDGMGGIEDELGRAVVLFELHNGGIGPVPLEIEDVSNVGAAPAVDRLVVVADDCQIVVCRRERLDPEVLRTVGVLVLVHVEIAPTLLVLLERRRRLFEQPDSFQQEIVEVESVRSAKRVAILPGQPRHLDQGARGDPHRRDLGRVHHVVLGSADRTEDRLGPGLAFCLHPLLAQDLLHERDLVVRVVDQEPTVQADGLAVAAQEACA